MLNTVRIHEKTCNGAPFKFAEVSGTPADHSSWWTFDDEQEVRDRHWHPKAGQTVMCVGAAFGSYVLPALAAGARVVAFSPADFDTELLEKNLSLNPELAKRCLVVRDAIHGGDGWFDPDHCVFAAHPVKDNTDHDTGQWLRCRSLDSWLGERPGLERIDWLQMDIEGAELDALKGAERLLRIEQPKILIENHNFHRKTMETDVRDFIIGLNIGYVMDGPYPHTAVSHSFFEVK